MSSPLDPVRLSDSPEADPRLRDALRLIRRDTPSPAELNALADRAQAALASAAVNGGHAGLALGALGKKLLFLVLAAAVLGYAGLQLLRSERAARPRAAAPALTGQTTPDTAVSNRPRALQPEAAPSRDPVTGVAVPRARGANDTPIVAAPGSRATLEHAAHRRRGSPAHAAPAAQPADQPQPTAAERMNIRAEADPTAPSPTADSDSNSELGLLERAQRELQSDPRQSLELLETHRTRFATSAYAQEREVLRLDALSQLHQTTALREGARAFLQRYPQSMHRARIERLLSE